MKKTYLLLVFATLFWGANFIFAKIALKTLDPSTIATGRFLLASIFLLLIFLFKRNSFKWKKVKSKMMILIISGIIGVFIYNLLMFTGLKSTSSTNAALIMLLPLLSAPNLTAMTRPRNFSSVLLPTSLPLNSPAVLFSFLLSPKI